jgi:hypothetical protein
MYFHGTGYLGRLCQNLGISGGGGGLNPPNPPRYATAQCGVLKQHLAARGGYRDETPKYSLVRTSIKESAILCFTEIK